MPLKVREAHATSDATNLFTRHSPLSRSGLTAWHYRSLLISCARRMRTVLITAFLLFCVGVRSHALELPVFQEPAGQEWDVQSDHAVYNLTNSVGFFSNDVR